MSTAGGIAFVLIYAVLIGALVCVDVPALWMRRRRAAADRRLPLAEQAGDVVEPVGPIGEVRRTNGGGLAMWNGFDWIPVPLDETDDPLRKLT